MSNETRMKKRQPKLKPWESAPVPPGEAMFCHHGYVHFLLVRDGDADFWSMSLSNNSCETSELIKIGRVKHFSEAKQIFEEACNQLDKFIKSEDEKMSKEGWAYLLNSRNEHYFVGGRSLCRKWLGLGLDFDRTLGQPKCKACQKALEKREQKARDE